MRFFSILKETIEIHEMNIKSSNNNYLKKDLMRQGITNLKKQPKLHINKASKIVIETKQNNIASYIVVMGDL